MEQLGGRKFIFAVISIALGFLLSIFGKVTGDQFLNFVMVIGGIYVIGNVGEKLASGK